MRVPPLISTSKDVKEKMELLDALTDVKFALNVIQQKTDEEAIHKVWFCALFHLCTP